MPSTGKIKPFLELIRWENLLMIILTMVLVRYVLVDTLVSKIIITPSVGGLGSEFALSLKFPGYLFAVLVAATVLISAGGYVINDYFDIRPDMINKGRIIIGTTFSRRRAILWHSIFTALGVIAGFYVSAKTGYFWFGIIFLLVSGLLYFYSASYKRQFLTGNIVIALLVAMIPMITVFFEWAALCQYCNATALIVPKFDFLFYWAGGFALFAFLTNLIREIIKDIEDYEGDKIYNKNTLPVVAGIKVAKTLSIIFLALTAVLLYVVWFIFLCDRLTLVYITTVIFIPMIFVGINLFRKQDKKHIHSASQTMKIIMIAGSLYIVVVKIIVTFNIV